MQLTSVGSAADTVLVCVCVCMCVDAWSSSCLAACLLPHRLGDVVGTFAWNTTRHLEAWYGVMGLGAICHTLNPRLSDRDITYIAGVPQWLWRQG
jgi:hypothetical protein